MKAAVKEIKELTRNHNIGAAIKKSHKLIKSMLEGVVSQQTNEIAQLKSKYHSANSRMGAFKQHRDKLARENRELIAERDALGRIAITQSVEIADLKHEMRISRERHGREKYYLENINIDRSKELQELLERGDTWKAWAFIWGIATALATLLLAKVV